LSSTEKKEKVRLSDQVVFSFVTKLTGFAVVL